jgi:hypothetical protein
MRFGKHWVALIATAAFLTAATGTASAATLTFGNPLTGTPAYTATNFGGDSGLMNTILASGASAASPVDGTIIDWGVGGGQGTFTPFIAQPSGTDFKGTALGTASAINVSTGTESPRQLTNLPIKAGQVFGLNTPTASLDYAPAGHDGYYDGLMAVGTTGPLYQGGTDGQSFAFNATVRYCEVPDVRGLRLAPAQQALKDHTCTPGNVIKPKNKKKRRKAKVVRSQSAAPGAKISDTAPIDLTLGPKKKKKAKK